MSELATGVLAMAKEIILQPRQTFEKIAEDDTLTIGAVLRNYLLKLAAIPTVSVLLASQLYDQRVFGITYKPTLSSALSSAAERYCLLIIGLAAFALVVSWLAPRFGGVSDYTRAFRLIVFAMVPSFLVAVFSLVPALAPLQFLGLYAFYLLYVGSPVLMKTPPTRSLFFNGAAIGSCFIAIFVFALVFSPGRMPDVFPASGNPVASRRPSATTTYSRRDSSVMDEVKRQNEAAHEANCRRMEINRATAQSEGEAAMIDGAMAVEMCQ